MKKIKEDIYKLKLHTKFSLVYLENVQRLVMALTLSGFYVRVSQHSSVPEYTILVYTDRI